MSVHVYINSDLVEIAPLVIRLVQVTFFFAIGFAFGRRWGWKF